MQGSWETIAGNSPGSSSASPKVLGPAPIQVIVPFQPLLEQVAECLRFSSPQYRYAAKGGNSVRLSIRTEGEPVAFIYTGGPALTPEESCEHAAMQAVCDLMTKYNVTVKDFTHTKRELSQKFTGVYNLKKRELEELMKGHTNLPLNEELQEPLPGPRKVVTLDYVTLLRHLTEKFPIHCTTMDTLRHGKERYTAFIIVSLPGVISGKKDMVSGCFKFPEAAKHELAQKVIEYVAPILNIEIIDANYDTPATNRVILNCALARETYLASKARLTGIEEEFEPSCVLLEEGATTPRAKAFQIPPPDGPPPPPKKIKLCSTCEHKSHVRPARAKPPRYFRVSKHVEEKFDRFKKG